MRLLTSFLFLTAVVLCVTNAQQGIRRIKRRLYGLCPPGFTQVETDCYYISDTEASWLDAHFECKDKRGKLAEPYRNADRRLRRHLLAADQDNSDLWIGGTYDWRGRKWQWANSGREIRYPSFIKLDRTGIDLRFHCAVLDPNKRYRWSADPCTEKHRFICQHAMPKVNEINREKIYRRWNATYPNQMASEVALEVTDTYRNGTRKRNYITLHVPYPEAVVNVKVTTQRKIRPIPSHTIDVDSLRPSIVISRRGPEQNEPQGDSPTRYPTFSGYDPRDTSSQPGHDYQIAPSEQRRPAPYRPTVDRSRPQTEFDRRVELHRQRENELKRRQREQRRRKLERERQERERQEAERRRQEEEEEERRRYQEKLRQEEERKLIEEEDRRLERLREAERRFKEEQKRRKEQQQSEAERSQTDDDRERQQEEEQRNLEHLRDIERRRMEHLDREAQRRREERERQNQARMAEENQTDQEQLDKYELLRQKELKIKEHEKRRRAEEERRQRENENDPDNAEEELDKYEKLRREEERRRQEQYEKQRMKEEEQRREEERRIEENQRWRQQQWEDQNRKLQEQRWRDQQTMTPQESQRYRAYNPAENEVTSDNDRNRPDGNRDRQHREHLLQLQEEAQRAEQERMARATTPASAEDPHEAEVARMERDRQHFLELDRKREEERKEQEEIMRRENEDRERQMQEMRSREQPSYRNDREEDDRRRRDDAERTQREEQERRRADRGWQAQQRKRQILLNRQEDSQRKARESQQEAERIRQQKIRQRIQSLSPEKRELFYKERERKQTQSRQGANHNEATPSE